MACSNRGGTAKRMTPGARWASSAADSASPVPRFQPCGGAAGIPDVAFIDPSFYKDKFGVEGKTVLLSFGLLSPVSQSALEAMADTVAVVDEVASETAARSPLLAPGGAWTCGHRPAGWGRARGGGHKDLHR